MTADLANMGGRSLAGLNAPAALERLATRLANAMPLLVIGYVLLFWPLVFGSPFPDPTPQQKALGWLVEVNVQDTSIAKQIAYPLFFVLSAACLAITGRYRNLPWNEPGLLILYGLIALALASVAWSVAPDVSVRRGMLFAVIAGTFVLSVYAGNSYKPMIDGVFFVLFVSAVLNAAALVIFTRGEIGHTGIYSHKNVFGWVAALILYFGIYGIWTGRAMTKFAGAFMVGVAPVMLIAAESKTSLGLAIIGPVIGALLWYAARRMRLMPSVIVPIAVVLVFFVFWLGRTSGTWTIFDINEAIFGNATLTGRTEIWDFVLMLISERPLLGFGYEGVFTTGVDSIVQRRAVGFVRGMPTAHNGYLDLWLQLGIGGIMLVIVFMLAALHAAARFAQINGPAGWLILSTMTFVAMHNCLESDMMISSNPLSMLVILLYLISVRSAAETERRRHGRGA